MSDPSAGPTRALLERLRRRRPGVPLRWFVPAAALAAVAGALAGPDEIAPTQVGVVTHWGGWALETAFVGAVFVACVATFRVVELLFRAQDAPALRTLPLAGGAVARDRFLAVSKETWLGVGLVFAFLAPVLLQSSVEYGLVTVAFLIASALLIPMVGYGVVVSAMVATVDADSIASKLTGGTLDRRGAVHHLSPGVAFGAVASLLLLLKLGSEEPLRVWSEGGALTMTNAGWIGCGIPLLTAFVAAVVSVRDFSKNFHEVQASLFDAEVPPPDTGYEYFQNAQRQGWLESQARPLVAALYRKDRLQVARSSPFLFPSTLFVAIIAGFSLWASAGTVVGPGTVGVMLGLWLVVVVAPSRRLARLPGEEEYGLAQMLAGDADRSAARRLAAATLVARHAVPLLVAGLVAGAESGHAATGVLAGVLGVLIGLEFRSPLVAWGAFGAIAALGAAIAGSLPILGPVAASAGFGLVALILFAARTLAPTRHSGPIS